MVIFLIIGYNLRRFNNEDILILYINYNNELGIDFKTHHKNSNMKDEIKKFIKNNKIKFDGDKIALSIGGIILAILLLIESPTNISDFELTYVSNDILSNEIVEVLNTEIKDKEDVVDSSVTNEIVNDTKIDNINVIDNQESNKVNLDNKDENINISNKESIKQDTENKESNDNIVIEDKSELITVYRSNGNIINLSLDDYLIGVVGAEMPASFSIEALKAQTIVARTYALKKIQKNEKLTDTVTTQSYKDINQLKKDWGSSFDIYYNKIKNAVLETKDLVIYYQDELIDAVYHSTSNGKTEDAIYVWGNNVPYLKSVDSSWDIDATSYLREVDKEVSNVLKLLGIDVKSDVVFEILSRDDSGRVLEIKIDNKKYSGVEFRNLLGLRSTDFDLVLENNNLKIITRGYGHGVGMSQYGANGMAKKGYNYEQILKHYYTGVSILKIN